MKQPEDNKTIDMLQEQKRGRGRPHVDNPLSPAERARRYRERKAEFRSLQSNFRDASRTVTKKTSDREFLLECKIRQLEAELDSHRQFAQERDKDFQMTQQKINDLRSALDIFIQAKLTKKGIPADVFKNITRTFIIA